MDKKDKLKYLSQWSELRKSILGNVDYGYTGELERITKELNDQYKKSFVDFQKTLAGNNLQTQMQQQAELFRSQGIGKQGKKTLELASLGFEEVYKDILKQQNPDLKKLYESLNPSLTETVKNLTGSFGTKESLASAMESFNAWQLQSAGLLDRPSRVKKTISESTTTPKDDQEEQEEQELPIKITQVKLQNFRFFHGEHIFKCENGESILLYGENGSGKSSLYKAFELLLKGKIEISQFESHINIHNQDEPYVEFEFDKEEDSLKIDEDHLEVEDTHLFVKNLSVFKPMLDYKDLLRIYFATSENNDSHNLFTLFKELLCKYPIEASTVLGDLEGDAYFTRLKEIVLDLEPSINAILKKFNFDMLVDEIACDAHSSTITIKVTSGEREIPNHTEFLNEAKLSALALAIFFAVILKLYSFMPEKSLKILVLDDLLLSLNMSNREKVLELLLDDELFKDFQLFIFTHDRAFFERSKQIFDYRQRGQWKYYEMYIDRDDEAEIEFPHIKISNPNLEKAKEHFKNKDYPACANYLRKEVENELDKFLKLDNLDEKIKLAKFKENIVWIRKLGKNIKKTLSVLESFENCEKVSSPDDIELCIKFSKSIKSSIEFLLEYIDKDFHFEEFEDVKLILKSILHPQSHNDVTKPLYKKELEDAIELMEAFKRIVDAEASS